jgi:hypothetical protein
MNEFLNPPREFGLMPFWFWNDDLSEIELARQIADFDAHGVTGFVIHPRVGLPRDIGWMSERMLHFVRFAVEEAKRREMTVIFYDEGMYPSGSSSGQVVARNPAHHCRGLAKLDLAEGEEPALQPGQNLVALVKRASGQRLAVIDRQVDSFIRGIHYIGEGPAEDEPPAGDILNPEAVQSFIELVYDKYAAAVGDHFGKTVVGIFTDEPGLLGRCRERNVRPGTTGILEHVNALLGYDFTPHLPALWYDEEPEARRYREAYGWALDKRLEETYYRPLSEWCARHNIWLMGHPAGSEDIGAQRYFHVPGQDIVWRWVQPNDSSALEGSHATQAKCSSSAMIHLGRRRNSNECFGAFGHNFTWEEMKWIVDWCFVRGVNWLFPHAFFYSVRGPRWDERPPDVGPNAAWWGDYKPFADYCRRMCWLNTDSAHICQIAILGEANRLPWEAAKVCQQHQRDFNYLEMRHLWEDAGVDEAGIRLRGMHYRALIIDGPLAIPNRALPALERLIRAGRVILWGEAKLAMAGALRPRDEKELLAALDRLAMPDLTITPAHPDIRYRHVVKGGAHYYVLTNEGMHPVTFRAQVAAKGVSKLLDPLHLTESEALGEIALPPYTTMLLRVM